MASQATLVLLLQAGGSANIAHSAVSLVLP